MNGIEYIIKIYYSSNDVYNIETLHQIYFVYGNHISEK